MSDLFKLEVLASPQYDFGYANGVKKQVIDSTRKLEISGNRTNSLGHIKTAQNKGNEKLEVKLPDFERPWISHVNKSIKSGVVNKHRRKYSKQGNFIRDARSKELDERAQIEKCNNLIHVGSRLRRFKMGITHQDKTDKLLRTIESSSHVKGIYHYDISKDVMETENENIMNDRININLYECENGTLNMDEREHKIVTIDGESCTDSISYTEDSLNLIEPNRSDILPESHISSSLDRVYASSLSHDSIMNKNKVTCTSSENRRKKSIEIRQDLPVGTLDNFQLSEPSLTSAQGRGDYTKPLYSPDAVLVAHREREANKVHEIKVIPSNTSSPGSSVVGDNISKPENIISPTKWGKKVLWKTLDNKKDKEIVTKSPSGKTLFMDETGGIREMMGVSDLDNNDSNEYYDYHSMSTMSSCDQSGSNIFNQIPKIKNDEADYVPRTFLCHVAKVIRKLEKKTKTNVTSNYPLSGSSQSFAKDIVRAKTAPLHMKRNQMSRIRQRTKSNLSKPGVDVDLNTEEMFPKDIDDRDSENVMSGISWEFYPELKGTKQIVPRNMEVYKGRPVFTR
jgi:hypothetical protein